MSSLCRAHLRCTNLANEVLAHMHKYCYRVEQFVSNSPTICISQKYLFCDSRFPMQAEYTKSPTANFPSNVLSCRSLSSSKAGPSGPSSLSDGELARNLQDSVKHRILYLSEQLRVEKASLDRNTVGFLKLVSTAGRQQAPHVWQALEKVNQRASATVAQIERRLHRCHQQLQELEEGCRPKGLVLRAESSLAYNREQPSEKALFQSPPSQVRNAAHPPTCLT